MNVTVDPKISLAGAPVVTLGGREYFMAPLVWRQLRVVVPLIEAGRRAIGKLRDKPDTILSTEDFDTLLGAVHGALTRTYPALTFEDLLDERITVEEVAAAFNTAIEQSQVYSAAKPAAPDAGQPAPEASEMPGEPSTLIG
jgi:hypothetical protein